MKPTEPSQYTIRQMTNLTGISEFALRAWETRYNAFKPKRTDTGRRLYSEQDVLKARMLFELTERKLKISDIARFSVIELKMLYFKERHQATQTSPLIQALMRDAYEQKWDSIQDALRNQRKILGPKKMIYQVILPLLREISAQVSQKQLSITQEHLFSSMIKENLYLLQENSKPSKSKIRLVIAAPENDFHEIGLLIAQVLAVHAGIKTLYLGPNMPKRELCEASLNYRATHLLISSTLSKKEGAKEDLFDLIHFLDTHLPKKIHLSVAGRNSNGLKLGISRKNKVLDSFEEYEKFIEQN